ncbi:MAG TPA: GIY-YIG nuclease family protein [Gammaproteobacteria bacterium]
MSYYYIYVLLSNKTGKWYTGYTHNLRKRFDEHNAGFCKSTKHGCPWKLIYYEACLFKEDAIAREKYLKSGMGKRYLKNRLKYYLTKRV